MKLLDLYCGGGGAAVGYYRAGFTDITGVDISPMPRYPYRFVQADALEYLAEHGQEYDVIHASPPCQGYSIMHNLPWLKGRDYPLLLLPTLEMLEALGKPYVVENVMGARHGAKGLAKRGLEAHGLKAGWLCGGMFGRPFYRHRLFATNWLWLAPGHPKHTHRIRPGSSLAGRAREIVFSAAEDAKGIQSWPGRREEGGHGLTMVPQDGGPARKRLGGRLPKSKGNHGLTLRPAYEHVEFSMPTITGNLGKWQNTAQANGVGIGHPRGWHLAAEAMGIDWMRRDELTQAIPPAYTFYIGCRLMVELGHEPRS